MPSTRQHKPAEESVTGIRRTRQRQAIVGVLMDSDFPLNAEDIAARLKDIGEKASLSTVYRTLDMLTEMDMAVKSLDVATGKATYEIKGKPHRHFATCVSCHRMISINHCPIGSLEAEIRKRTAFRVTGHRLDVYGYCPDCENKD